MEAPVTPVWITVQVNVVPLTLLVRVIKVAEPEQKVCEPGLAMTLGIGFTVTVTSTGDPVHPLADGVMVYTAVPGTVPAFVSVCAIDDPLPLEAPVTPVCTTVQINVELLTLLVRLIVVAEPEQNVSEAGLAVTTGIGFTVTVTSIGIPVHPLAVGVIVYTAVPGTVPAFVRVCAIDEPLPGEAPATPVWTTAPR